MAVYFYNREAELYHMANADNELYHYGIPGMKWGKKKLKQIKNWYEERKKYHLQNQRYKSIKKSAKKWVKQDKRIAKVERRIANRRTDAISEFISPRKTRQTKDFNSRVMANRKAYERALEEQRKQKLYKQNEWRLKARKSRNADAINSESKNMQKYVDWDVEYYKLTGKKRPYKNKR